MTHASALREFQHPRLLLGIWWSALAATIVVCLLPMPALDVPFDHVDKLEHGIGYLLLAAWAGMLFRGRWPVIRALLVLSALGVLIEGLQMLVPWRSGGDAADVLANLIGTALGGSIALTPLAAGLEFADRRLAALRGRATGSRR